MVVHGELRVNVWKCVSREDIKPEAVFEASADWLVWLGIKYSLSRHR